MGQLNQTTAQVQELLNAVPGKQDAPASVSAGTNITLANNTAYSLTDVTTLTLTTPSGDFGSWGIVEIAASGDVTVTLPVDAVFIGDAPVFANGEKWEFSVWNNRWVWGKVG